MASILVSTSHSLFEINVETLQLRRLHSGRGLYYGICVTESLIYCAARNRLVSSSVPQEAEQGEIILLNRQLELTNKIDGTFALRDLHEICWDSGFLWATCPYDNLVAKWDGHVWQKWFPLPSDMVSAKDVHHYNSLFFEDHSLWLLAHNFGQSELLRFEKDSMDLKERHSLGVQAHNIWRENGLLHTCSSAEGAVLSEQGVVARPGGFVRGYCRVGDLRFVGISELAERSERDFTEAKIAVYDSHWNLLKTVSLGREGLLLDIRLLYSEA